MLFILILILMYLIVGIISLFVMALCHLIRAELLGYAAIDWWVKQDVVIDWSDPDTRARIIINMILWPMRIAEFIQLEVPEYYRQYDLK